MFSPNESACKTSTVPCPKPVAVASPGSLPLHILEDTIHKTVTPWSTPVHHVTLLHCNSWLCAICKPSRGRAVQDRLLAQATRFREPRLFTLTVSRSFHYSPESAYRFVMGRKFIARLLTKELGIRTWVWVLEPQEGNGDGWPHFHILIDVSPLPPRWFHVESKEARKDRPADTSGWIRINHYFDLDRVHHLLRKWNIGEQCRLSPKQEFQSPMEAIRYVTKTLIKNPEHGYPPWMLNYPNLRIIQPSNDLGAIVTGGTKPGQKRMSKAAGTPLPPRRPRAKLRPPVDMVAECGRRYSLAFDDGHSVTRSTGIVSPYTMTTTPGLRYLSYFDFRHRRYVRAGSFVNNEACREFEKFWSAGSLAHRAEVRDIARLRDELLSQWDRAPPSAPDIVPVRSPVVQP